MNRAVPESTPLPLLLLVDDKPEELRWLIPLLQPHFRLALAADGLSALHKAESLQPELVLLDINLPDLDGLTLGRRLKASPSTAEVPLIFLSAHNEPAARIEGLGLGAVDFIGKDAHPEEVLARLRLHLALSRRLRAAERPTRDAPTSTPDQTLLRSICSHVQAHLDQGLSVAAIARHFGLSDKRLLSLFREQLGQTVSGYISEERMRAGQRLLQQTRLEVQQIAQMVGYANPANFATAFRERHGLSPQAYRQSLRQGSEPAEACP
ncbi:DNA-binding response regulator [Kinneretia asaccharophila]|uniref:AraC family two component transcriptional regulator n=1 Tax=Roseateles asaccharophilus TaxID=582607 RepID=A0A4R6NG60_9BURK|nr:DNA-binding response regulator [Roseateles asaccharophilus]MDN3543038.1 DNA-binding response regulator [Roseateles asaccharophilus]TDP13264.1 AraC family two component transcriptional regulator [Roseateles asaccharophilus]